MNVFVLSTGRCGSTTFVRACTHITNYTAGHVSRAGMLGSERMAFPKDHIEADARLPWFLGRLDEAFGDDALYVHLTRNDQAVARSHVDRWHFGITKAYREGILHDLPEGVDPMSLTMDYVHTVNANIRYFMKQRPHTMLFRLEHAKEDFKAFWTRIGAQGDLEAALDEFEVRHNATKERSIGVPARIWYKLQRILKGIPDFLRKA